MANKIWLITGVSGGLGRALAVAVAGKGYIVYGTLRKAEQIEAFNQLCPGFTFGLLMDVNNPIQVDAGIHQVISAHGKIDVLVNNAGYGLFGAIEEVSMEESRAQMETNFFGALAVTKAVLPMMRKQQSGHIFQVSSVAGFRSTPGLGIYNASKYALEGFSEALWHEVNPLGIHVTIVEPGPFRTNWAGDSSVRSANTVDAYKETAGARIRTIHAYSGTQPGDPEKAAAVVIKASESNFPPLRLPLGQPAIDGILEKCEWVKKDIDSWSSISSKTDFN